MSARKLFVSHSSKTPENLSLLKKLCQALGVEGAGFQVLVDQGGGIPAGADWDKRLNEWMAECHAAVILFSEAACKHSDWVKKEAAILSWRREIEDGFALIPVLLDGLTPEDLAQGLFGVMQINKSQCVRCGASADLIAEKIVTALGTPTSAASRTPFDDLEAAITRILERQAAPETLERAWEDLESQHKVPWQPTAGDRFAAALARHLLRDGCRALKELKILLDKIRPKVGRDQAQELLSYLGALWVQAEAAGGIPAARHGSRVVALNGNYFSDFTGRRYLERAWPFTDRRKLVLVNSRTVDGTVEDIRAEFRPRARGTPNAAVDRYINAYADPVLVFLPQPEEPSQLPDKDLINALRNQYQQALFVVPTGPELPEGIEQTLDARPLLPILDLQMEESQLLDYEDTRNFIEKQLHGTP